MYDTSYSGYLYLIGVFPLGFLFVGFSRDYLVKGSLHGSTKPPLNLSGDFFKKSWYKLKS